MLLGMSFKCQGRLGEKSSSVCNPRITSPPGLGKLAFSSSFASHFSTAARLLSGLKEGEQRHSKVSSLCICGNSGSMSSIHGSQGTHCCMVSVKHHQRGFFPPWSFGCTSFSPPSPLLCPCAAFSPPSAACSTSTSPWAGELSAPIMFGKANNISRPVGNTYKI